MARTRRTKGEGSITERPDGLFEVRINLGVVDGKRKRKSVYAKTMKEARAALKELQRQLDAGMNLSSQMPTVAQFLEQWLTQIIAVNNAPSTLRSYRDAVNNHITPHVGKHPLDKLTVQHVQAMIATLAQQARTISPRTSRRSRNKPPIESATLTRTVTYAPSVLKRALNVAIKWGWITRNVAALATVPSYEPRKGKALSVEQAHALLEAAVGHRLYVLILLALTLGLRRGELLALRWVDIDFEASQIAVTGTTNRVSGKKERRKTKTPTSHATLPLPASCAVALRQHRQSQRLEQLATHDWEDHDLVFPSERGTSLEATSLLEQFAALLKRASVPHIRFHDLRHTCASFLVAGKVHPRVAKEILRHARISTTMELYAHVTEEDEREAVDTVADVLKRDRA